MSATESSKKGVGTSAADHVAQPINIHFEDLCYSVTELKFGFWPAGQKKLLKNVSGDFQCYKLTALIGESGCGKSTMMNVISGYRSKGVSGRIFMNGTQVNMDYLTKKSCYVMQDSLLQPLLTPCEAMQFLANLKLHAAASVKESIISETLKKFSLWEHKNTLTRNLSGGERKRLAIALELISNPSILILDEPTSGLDSRSAGECLRILRDLSSEARTIICSIHQPSMLLLEMFDNAYVLSNGRCVYQGAVNNLLPYLSANNIECPVYYNPAEYILEVCTSDMPDSDGVSTLVQSIDNGKSQEWLVDAVCWNPPPLSTSGLKMRDSRPQMEVKDSQQHTGSLRRQFWYLLKRRLLVLTRDEFQTWLQLASNAMIGISSGVFFYNKGNDAHWVMFNFNMIFFIVMSALFDGFMSKIISFAQEFMVVEREHFNRWYCVKAHLMASTITDVPVQVVGVALMTSLYYYFCGFPLQWNRVAQFSGISILMALLAQDYGVILGTLFTMRNCVIFGVVSLMPWVMFAGFFIYYRDCPTKICQWLFDASPLRRSLEGAMISTYGHNRKPLDCYEIFCHYKFPAEFLKHIDMEDASYWFSFTFVFILFVCAKVCCLAVMKYKLTRRS